MWHLPKVVGLVPVARVGLVAHGGPRVVNSRGQNQPRTPRNSHREQTGSSATVNKTGPSQPLFVTTPRNHTRTLVHRTPPFTTPHSPHTPIPSSDAPLS